MIGDFIKNNVDSNIYKNYYCSSIIFLIHHLQSIPNSVIRCMFDRSPIKHTKYDIKMNIYSKDDL